MNTKETIHFGRVLPLKPFGDQTILSAQIERHPNTEKVIVQSEEDRRLTVEFLSCAYPDKEFLVTLKQDEGIEEIVDGDRWGEIDLSTDLGFEDAVAERFGDLDGFDFSKPDEAIFFVNGRVIKYFADPKVVANRLFRASLLSGLVPNIDRHGSNFYSYEFAAGKTIYESLRPGMTTEFLNWCDEKLWNPQEIALGDTKRAEFVENCKVFYKDKTLGRISKYWQSCGHTDAPSNVNGIQTETLESLLSKIDWDKLADGVPSRFHGDLHFDNSIYNPATDKFLLLDWRHEFAGMTEYADMYYDLAKFYGGLITPYNSIKNNDFLYLEDGEKITLGIKKPEYLDEAMKEFEEFVKQHGFDMERISLITGLIFINMSPLHTPPFNRYLHHLGKMMLTNHFEEYGTQNK